MILLFIQLIAAIKAGDWPMVIKILGQLLNSVPTTGAEELDALDVHLQNCAKERKLSVP